MHKQKITVQRVNVEEWTNTEILEAVKRDVEQLGLSEDPDTPEYKLTITLYAAAVLDTTDVMRLSSVTGYDVNFIQKIADNMALSKLWIDGHPRCEEWWDEKTGKISFILHELVANGFLVRTDRFRNGRPVYQAVNALGRDMLQ